MVVSPFSELIECAGRVKHLLEQAIAALCNASRLHAPFVAYNAPEIPSPKNHHFYNSTFSQAASQFFTSHCHSKLGLALLH